MSGSCLVCHVEDSVTYNYEVNASYVYFTEYV